MSCVPAGELRRLLELRAADLEGWGGRRAAAGYVATVVDVADRERALLAGSTTFSEAVARNLHTLLAYEDPYEAARLGRWSLPGARLLAHGRRLRGTCLDPFGWAHARRAERELPREYLELVEAALARLAAEPADLDLALEAAELPQLTSGDDELRPRGVERFRARAEELRAALARSEQ